MENDFQIIPSVRDLRHLSQALTLPGDNILLSGAHIGNLRQLVAKCHQSGKKVVVNHELIAGLGSDKMAFQMLKQMYNVDAIISSNINKIHLMKNLELKTVYRITLMDSMSVDNAIKILSDAKINAVELRPYYHAIEFLPKLREAWDGDYYAAGFVNTEERIIQCKEAGFKGVMTSTKELWSLEM